MGTAFGLINRITRQSDISFVNKNIATARDILTKNKYPNYIIQRAINKTTRTNNTQQTTQIEGEKIYRSLTYVEGLSQRLEKMFRKIIPEICIAYKVRQKIGDIFTKLKDKISYQKLSNVIYQIPCNGCNKIYIGETERHCETRIKEHERSTSKPPNDKQEMTKALAKHYNLTGHNFMRLKFR